MTDRPSILRWLGEDRALLLYLPLLKLLLHFWNNWQGGYGIFRDELYFIACGEHLAWGYVDQPPVIALVAALTRSLLGDSLFSIRFFPAVAGAGVVLVTGLIARELGAGRFGRFLAQLAALVAPVFLAIHTILTMNVFEHLLWALAVYVLILIVKRDAPRLWLLFGVIAGLGLMNKHSMAFLCVGLFVGLLVSRERWHLRQRWFWLGAGVALLIVLPHLVWQAQHGFPTWELLRNGQLSKNAPFALGSFLFGMFLEFHPVNIVLAAGAVWFLFRSRGGATFRFLGWTLLAVLALFVALKAKPYYLAPIYPLVYAAGATALAAWTANRVGRWIRFALVALMVALGAATAPLAMPLLSPQAFIAYAQRLGIEDPPTERHEMGPLPQYFADMHGWSEMVELVGEVYNRLTAEERGETAIFASNYGQAGAIDFYGWKYGLPKAVSGHNNYFLWGPPAKEAQVVILIGVPQQDIADDFEQIEEGPRFRHPYAMPYEQRRPILIARKPRLLWNTIWPYTKVYI